MVKKLENWIKKLNNADLTKSYQEYIVAEIHLKNLEIGLLAKLMKMPEFEERLAKAFHEDDFAGKSIPCVGFINTESPETFITSITTGEEFKTVRKAKYLTQEQASQKLKIQLYLIRNWEQKGVIEDQYLPKVQKLLKF